MRAEQLLGNLLDLYIRELHETDEAKELRTEFLPICEKLYRTGPIPGAKASGLTTNQLALAGAVMIMRHKHRGAGNGPYTTAERLFLEQLVDRHAQVFDQETGSTAYAVFYLSFLAIAACWGPMMCRAKAVIGFQDALAFLALFGLSGTESGTIFCPPGIRSGYPHGQGIDQALCCGLRLTAPRVGAQWRENGRRQALLIELIERHREVMDLFAIQREEIADWLAIRFLRPTLKSSWMNLHTRFRVDVSIDRDRRVIGVLPEVGLPANDVRSFVHLDPIAHKVTSHLLSPTGKPGHLSTRPVRCWARLDGQRVRAWAQEGEDATPPETRGVHPTLDLPFVGTESFTFSL